MPEDELVVARVIVTRRLTTDDDGSGDVVFVETDPPDLAVIESVGMLRLAENIVIDEAWGHGDDDDPA